MNDLNLPSPGESQRNMGMALYRAAERANQAEAALERVRQLHRRHDCATDHIKTSTPVPCVNDGVCLGCGAPQGYECETLRVIDRSETDE